MVTEKDKNEVKDVLLDKVTGGLKRSSTISAYCYECMDWKDIPYEGPYVCPDCNNEVEVNIK